MPDKPNAIGNLLKRLRLSTPSSARSLPVIKIKAHDYIIDPNAHENDVNAFLAHMDQATCDYISDVVRHPLDDGHFQELCAGTLEVGRGN